jgi:hypothetical protein
MVASPNHSTESVLTATLDFVNLTFCTEAPPATGPFVAAVPDFRSNAVGKKPLVVPTEPRVPTRDNSFETREHTLSAAAIELVRLFAFSLRSSHDEDVWSVDESFLGFFTLGKSPKRSIFFPLEK